MSEDVGVTRPDLGSAFDAHVAAEFVPRNQAEQRRIRRT
jgi:hypothetical protein